MEKDSAYLKEINYFVTCHIIFSTISHIYVVKRIILLAVIQLPLSVLVCLWLITLNSWSSICNKMSCFLSHSLETSCGDSWGVSGLFNLLQCTDSVESHLSLIHLSKESVTDRELIQARARLFDKEDSVLAKMLVCAKHRHTYGKFWRQRSACQYPTHPGSDSKGAKSRYSVNLEMSKAISKMYGVLVQVGSGRNKWFKILKWLISIHLSRFLSNRSFVY